MIAYVASRCLQGIPVILGVSFLVFAAMHLTPGNPAEVMLREFGTSGEDVARLKRQLGLDRPWLLQYKDFLVGALHGDLGRSLFTRRPVTQQIFAAIPSTLVLTGSAIGVAILLGMPLGILAAIRQRTWVDSASMAVSVLGVSAPVFWFALVLIIVFSITLEWLPATGSSGLRSLVLPTVTLGLSLSGLVARLVRSSMIEVLRAEYIVTARAKGARERSVLVRHALRNALIPLVTVVGLQIGHLLSGAVVVETVFARQGLGSMLINAILQKDFPLVQGTVFCVAVAYVTINIFVDIAYSIIDPRIRYPKAV